MADNANRFFALNSSGQASSMEKLSSGMRINRAGDDAAGLAISEKMRNQINGLDQASRNAQDGISLIQTAEGALAETHEMLQRMRELSIQSMNDTYTDSDRAKIDLEVQELLQEIDGIADKTEFNEQKLLAGEGATATAAAASMRTGDTSLEELEEQLETKQAQLASLNVGTELAAVTNILDELDGMLADAGIGADDQLYITVTADSANNSITNSAGSISGATYDSLSTEQKLALYDALQNNASYNDLTNNSGFALDYSSGASPALSSTAGNAAYTDLNTKIDAYNTANPNNTYSVDSVIDLAEEIADLEEQIDELTGGFNEELVGTQTFEFHVGANQNQKISVEIEAMGVIQLELQDVDMSTKEASSASLALVDSAIEKISEQRAILGAAQNRLEHTIKNVDNTSENLQTAESNIRDTDMAEEMVTLTKYNILSQASQSMLSQANQVPQQVLQLL